MEDICTFPAHISGLVNNMPRKLASVISYPCHELRWNTGLNNYVCDTETDILTNSALIKPNIVFI